MSALSSSSSTRPAPPPPPPPPPPRPPEPPESPATAPPRAGDGGAAPAVTPPTLRSAAATLAGPELLGRRTVTLRPWPDPLVESFGHDPRSPYAERYWLPVLGPSALWLLRHLVACLDEHPDQVDIELADVPRAIGVGGRNGTHSPFANTVNRLIQFGFLRVEDDRTLSVRTRMPTLNRRQLLRVPERLRAVHQQEVDAAPRPGSGRDHRARARALALSLLELGEDVPATEKQLHRWQFHPAVAFEAVRWAAAQHGQRAHGPHHDSDGDDDAA